MKDVQSQGKPSALEGHYCPPGRSGLGSILADPDPQHCSNRYTVACFKFSFYSLQYFSDAEIYALPSIIHSPSSRQQIYSTAPVVILFKSYLTQEGVICL